MIICCTFGTVNDHINDIIFVSDKEQCMDILPIIGTANDHIYDIRLVSDKKHCMDNLP